MAYKTIVEYSNYRGVPCSTDANFPTEPEGTAPRGNTIFVGEGAIVCFGTRTGNGA